MAPGRFVELLRPRVRVAGDGTVHALTERMRHYNVPGVAVAILENGEVVFAGGFGVLSQGGGEAVSADTVFSAGSVSKVASAPNRYIVSAMSTRIGVPEIEFHVDARGQAIGLAFRLNNAALHYVRLE